jgi:hypothetical protein
MPILRIHALSIFWERMLRSYDNKDLAQISLLTSFPISYASFVADSIQVDNELTRFEVLLDYQCFEKLRLRDSLNPYLLKLKQIDISQGYLGCDSFQCTS